MQYRILACDSAADLEDEMNELAKAGYRMVGFGVRPAVPGYGPNVGLYAVMERDT